MYLVDDPDETVQKDKPVIEESDQTSVNESPCIKSIVSLISNIVETACEHEHDLGLMRLVNLLDLYQVHLHLANALQSESRASIVQISYPEETMETQKSGYSEFVSFENFVRDSRLLQMAAAAASLDTGEKVATPLPLTISANT